MGVIQNAIAALRGQNPLFPNVIYSTEQQAAVLGLSVEELYRTQPYLRTVVSFLARNIAQLGLHSFERVSDTDRQRLTDDPISQLLKQPNAQMTTYDLVFSLVGDLALYDEALWILGTDATSPSGWTIQPIPPSWVTRKGGGSVFAPEWVEFTAPGVFNVTRVNMTDIVWFHGWNPGLPSSVSSPVEALKQILAEQISAQTYRQQMWRKGGRVGGYLSRPAGAKWDPKVREKFQRQWTAKYAGNDGPEAGGTPILEDGMEYNRVGFNAREEEFVDGAKLSFATVASVYHVNPTMIGLLDNANFSNVREFRKMLYGDTLGSTISMIEDRLNTFVVPLVSAASNAYVEFNIAEKLQGNFEEQATALSTSVGRPWMTADEARALNNMPSMGGDAERLVTPLNVLVGGQASPRDSASPKGAVVRVKAKGVSVTPGEIPQPLVDKSEQVLRDFFKRQRKSVLSVLGAKAAADWWDADRWDGELSDDLFALAKSSAAQIGKASAKELGFDPDDYDEDRTLAFLRAVADSRAGAVNSTTRDRIQEALDSGDDPGDAFDEAEDTRSGSAGSALMAAVVGFAVVETASQLLGETAQKTWNVNSSNPRPDHAAMDGETVGIGETFSNGASWPGDPTLGAEGNSNCTCGVTVAY